MGIYLVFRADQDISTAFSPSSFIKASSSVEAAMFFGQGVLKVVSLDTAETITVVKEEVYAADDGQNVIRKTGEEVKAAREYSPPAPVEEAPAKEEEVPA